MDGKKQLQAPPPKPLGLDDLRRIDALDLAEKLTGKSYKDDEETSRLGAAIHRMNEEAKRTKLHAQSDSYYNMRFSAYTDIVEDLGFELVFEEIFKPHDAITWLAPETNESFRIYWRAGLLLTCESYRGTGLNSASVYLNAEFSEGHEAWAIQGLSGSMNGELHKQGRYVWVGHLDGREALRRSLEELEESSSILPVWVERPWMSLLNYAESKDSASSALINSLKLGELPAHVQEAIPSGRDHVEAAAVRRTQGPSALVKIK